VNDLPARFHISSNPRNPPVWIVPEEGWEIYFEAHFNLFRDKFSHGEHGYDPALPSMHGILIAHGPSFKADGSTIPAVENIQIYNLLCRVLGLPAAPNDGDDRLAQAMLGR
jgi:predicted AlkP superfamily pyrophosphatase or phosphodiesterase